MLRLEIIVLKSCTSACLISQRDTVYGLKRNKNSEMISNTCSKKSVPLIFFHYHVGECLSSSLKRAILEVVVSGVAASPQDVTLYASCTLLAASVSEGQAQTSSLILQCVKFLQDNEFICIQNITDKHGKNLVTF